MTFREIIFYFKSHTKYTSTQTNKKQTPWPESASELYRASDRRLSAKLLPTSADRGRRVVSATDSHDPILGFLDNEEN
jgi:hypothetical protein